MEFSVLKIELLFTLIQQFNLSLHIEQRKFQISPPPGEQDHSNAPPQVQHTIKSPAHPITCLTFCHFFQLNCMADQDSWYDLDWKTTDGINFILTNKGILLQYQSKTFGISLQSEFSFMWRVIQVEWKTLLLLVLKNILAICWQGKLLEILVHS